MKSPIHHKQFRVRLKRLSFTVATLILFLHQPIKAADAPLQQEQFWSQKVASTDGSETSLKSVSGSRATAFVFINTSCPISNGYVPTLNQFAQQFAEQGITVVGINSNDGVTLREMASHRKEFGIVFPVLRDQGAAISRQLNASHCPEVVLVDTNGVIRYRGRVDERYSRRGGPVGEIRRHDLRIAIEQFLSGDSITVTKTDVVGCPIFRIEGRSTQSQGDNSTVTYAKHIEPLLRTHCLGCHRPNGIGPFSLSTYEQAVSWADDIASFTSNRQMPPWMPAEGYGAFHNRRSMSQKEIDLIAEWVKAGTPPGNLKEVPPAPVFQEGWSLGKPDLILKPERAFEVPADGKDVYQCFVISNDSETDRYVSGIEVRPGNNRIVHHVLNYIDTSHRSMQLDEQFSGLGYATSAGFPGFIPAGSLGGWAPGNQPQVLPDGMARVLPAKCKIVIQVHYHPSGKPETDQTQIGLHFSKTPVTRVVRVLPVMPFGGPWSGMKIPAGDSNAEVRTSMIMPRDSLVLNITPHMHLLGKDMKVTATLPDGTVQPLIYVPRWDFNWQESYQYQEPVSLPKGTRLDLVAHFDNSAENPSNPNTPPKEVRWGEQTTSEMCIAFLQLVPLEPASSSRDLKAPTPGDLLSDALLTRRIFQSRPQNKTAP